MIGELLLENSITDGLLLEDNIGILLLESFSFNNNINSFIHGQIIVNNNVILSTHGHNNIVGTKFFFIHSDPVMSTLISEFVDLFINGPTIINSNFDSFIHGHNTEINNIDIFTNGHLIENNNINLFTSGIGTNNQNINLFTHGFNLQNNNINLTVIGNEFLNQSLDLFIPGKNLIADEINLFINTFNVFGQLFNLFIQGIDNSTDYIDLFIHGIDSLIDNTNLFILGADHMQGFQDLLTKGHESINESLDLYLRVKETNNINLFIRGIQTPQPAICPVLDSTASIQIGDDLIEIYQSRIDALINQLGKNILLEFNPIKEPCTNCFFDVISGRSNGVYKLGGPIPFTRGQKCPFCKGVGFLEIAVEKCIKVLIQWNPSDAQKYGISVDDPSSIVRFKGFLTDGDDMVRAKTAISNHDIESTMKLRVKLIRGPIAVGLRESRYCISFWTLLDS